MKSIQEDIAQAEQQLQELRTHITHAQGVVSVQEAVTRLEEQAAEAEARLNTLLPQIVVAEEAVALQEVGLYHYRTAADHSDEYKDRLDSLRQEIKRIVKAGLAVTGSQNFTYNNSKAKGNKMVRDFQKLLLRAYNSEAEALAKGMRPHKLKSAENRLTRTAESVSRLGTMLDISITAEYHNARLAELALVADYLAKKEEEKEAEREHKAMLREQAKVEREIRAARKAAEARLFKERTHYENLLAAAGDEASLAGSAEAEQAAAMIREIEESLAGLSEREANIRAGYVYVISNVGSFGEGVVKIGLTRRLNPMDRVRELGDASVPFRFDIHAMIWSDDAVTLENTLHRTFESQRLNTVNLRREYFAVSPSEVRKALKSQPGVSLLDFTADFEAEEWRQSGSPRAARLLVGRSEDDLQPVSVG